MNNNENNDRNNGSEQRNNNVDSSDSDDSSGHDNDNVDDSEDYDSDGMGYEYDQHDDQHDDEHNDEDDVDEDESADMNVTLQILNLINNNIHNVNANVNFFDQYNMNMNNINTHFNNNLINQLVNGLNNNNGTITLNLSDLLFTQVSLPTIDTIPVEVKEELLTYFRENYYENATLDEHHIYIIFLHEFRVNNHRYPTKNEFFAYYRPVCMCVYSLMTTEESYCLASSFFMTIFGTVENLSCQHCYYHSEFYTLEHRHPNDLLELLNYINQLSMMEANPILFTETTHVCSSTDEAVVTKLRDSVTTVTGQVCSICQYDITNQNAVCLQCKHYYHADDKDCCETGTIFTWLQHNTNCPVCRATV
jgi:hypothetical protein